MEWLTKIADITKLPTRHLALGAVVTALILFLPTDALRAIHLDELRLKYGFVIGVAFLISSSLVLLNFACWLLGIVTTRKDKVRLKKKIEQAIINLDSAERAVLREFIIRAQNTIKLPLDYPVVAGLIARGLLCQVGNFGEHSTAGMLFSFRITDAARNLITPDVVAPSEFLVNRDDGPWSFSDAGKKWVLANRPHFIEEIERHDRLFHRTL